MIDCGTMAEPTEDPNPAGGTGAAAPGGEAQPSEEELRAQYEEQIRQVRVQDLVLQSAVSILQLSARRIAKEDERDLEQARVGIDAAASMIDHAPGEAQDELRQAVSELKMLFAQHSGEGPPESSPGAAKPAPEGSPNEPKQPPPGSKDSGLWTPGS
ncbi:hypothetical protein BH20ACT15_BH20ACT15_07630 [soil metagenome]